MLKNIIQKEILNNIFSSRFLVTFLLLVIIVLATSVILTNDYVRNLDEFSMRRTERENYLRDYAHFNRIAGVINPAQPPLPFYSLIRGISLEVNIEEFDNDPLPVMFPLIDLTFIVTILLSLIALLFSYDSICGEKEEGTLKLMLSNNVSRAKVLLGKTIGGTLTLLIPFTFSLGLSQIVILLNPRISWKGSDWGALALIFFCGCSLCHAVLLSRHIDLLPPQDRFFVHYDLSFCLGSFYPCHSQFDTLHGLFFCQNTFKNNDRQRSQPHLQYGKRCAWQ